MLGRQGDDLVAQFFDVRHLVQATVQRGCKAQRERDMTRDVGTGRFRLGDGSPEQDENPVDLFNPILYRLSEDPEESDNVLPQHPRPAWKLRTRLEAFAARESDGDAPVVSPDAATIERLKALGYL